MGLWMIMAFLIQGQTTDGLMESVRVAPSYFIENRQTVGKTPLAGPGVSAFLDTARGRIYFTKEGFHLGSAQNKDGQTPAAFSFGEVQKKRGDKGPRLDKKTGAPYHYLIGDPSQWQTHLPTYQQLVYPQVWQGIDVTFQGFRDRLEARWILEPNADPGQIQMNLEGLELRLLPNGSVSNTMAAGSMVLSPAKAYQTIEGEKVWVDAAYKILDHGRVQFELGPYQKQFALVISPVITWSAVFGDDTSDKLEAIDFDSNGNILVGGTMQSTSIFALQETFLNPQPSNRNVFITKLDPTGSAPDFSIYLGGNSDEDIVDLAVMPDNSFWVMGKASGVFPVTDGSTNQGFGDLFLTHISADGSTLLFSTLVGGTSAEFPRRMAVSGNRIAIGGETWSTNFPVTGNALDATLGGSRDGFVCVLDSSTNTWIFSSYWGGSDTDQVKGLDFDSASNLILCGETRSSDLTTSNGCYDKSYNGNADGFLTKISNSFALTYSTYIGGPGIDSANDVVVPSSGEAVVTGKAGQAFPTTAGVLDPNADFQDAFLLKMNTTGTGLIFSTALGGSNADEGLFVKELGPYYCLAGTSTSSNFPTSDGSSYAAGGDIFVTILDAMGQLILKSTLQGGQGSDRPSQLKVRNNAPYLVGWTSSMDFPIVGPALQINMRGSEDAFLAYFDTSLNLTYASFLGGEGQDRAESAALDSSGNILVTGSTTSDNFPVTTSQFPFTRNRGADGFISKLSQDGSTLLFSARFGGSGDDTPTALVVDALDEIYIAGTTGSSNFYSTPGAYDVSFGGLTDGFLMKLNSSADSVIYSSYLGSSGWEEIFGLAVHGGVAHVVGRTSSTDFPTTAGAIDTTYQGGINDGFLTKFNTDGNGLLYSSFIGGSMDDRVIAVAADSSATYLTGYTVSSDFPTTAGAFDETYNANRDIFVMRLTNSGALLRSTFLGGNAIEQGQAIMLSGSGPIIAGWTRSANFPTQNAWDSSYNGGSDGVLAKLDANLATLSFSTYLGGSGTDVPTALAEGLNGSIWVAGDNQAGSFPTTPGAYQTVNLGSYDAFAMQFSSTGTTLQYATLLGSSGNDNCRQILAKSDGSIVLAGATGSEDYPITTGAYTTSSRGALDVSITMLCPAPTPGPISGPLNVCETLPSVSYSILALPGVSVYQWSVPAGAVILSGQTTTSITVDMNGNGGEISVQAEVACGLSEKTSIQVAIDAAVGAVGTVEGASSFCQNDVNTYSVVPVANASNYVWTVPSGSVIQSGQGTPSITVQMGNAGGDVFVDVSNTCSSEASPAKALSIIPALSDLGPVTSSGPYCPNTGGYTFSVPALAGATDYQWTVPVDATITSGQGSNTIVVEFGIAFGNVSVAAANACDATAASSTYVAFSSDLQFTQHPETQFSCSGQDITFSVAVDGSPPIQLQWYKDGMPLAEFGSTLTLTNISSADEGSYQCLAEGPCFSEFSNAAGLFLEGIPTLAMNPPARALGLRDPVYQLDITCGTPPYTLNWITDPIASVVLQGDGIVMNPPPTETTFIQCDYTDSAGNGTFSAYGLLLVAQDPLYRDLNQDGCNNLHDLWLLMQSWQSAEANDPNGDGWIDIRDFLYINLDDPLNCPL